MLICGMVSPITIDHPQDRRGGQTSANDSPELMEVQVGKFFNVKTEGGSLKGELWIDSERIGQISPESLSAIEEGRLEVSVGLFSGGDGKKGTWQGEKYEETLFGFVPDHIALLPNGVGACSWADGCGVRVNRKAKRKVEVIEKISMFVDKEGNVSMFGDLKNLKLDHEALRERLSSEVNKGRNVNDPFVFIESVSNNSFIYAQDNSSGEFFKRGFTVDKNDVVTLTGLPVSVKKQVKFIEFSKEGKSMISKERIDALFANNKNFYLNDDEGSRSYLSNLSEEAFVKVEECGCDEVATLKENAEKAETEKAELVKTNAELTEKVSEFEDSQKTDEEKREEDLKTNRDALKSEILSDLKFEDVMGKAPKDVQDTINEGIKNTKQKRELLINALDGSDFTKEELEGESIERLEKFVSLAKVTPDYSGNGGNDDTLTVNKHEKKADGTGVPKMLTIGEAMAKSAEKK